MMGFICDFSLLQTALQNPGQETTAFLLLQPHGRGVKRCLVCSVPFHMLAPFLHRGGFCFHRNCIQHCQAIIAYIVTSSITPGSRQFRGCPISGNSQQSINAHQTIKKTLLFTPYKNALFHTHTHTFSHLQRRLEIVQPDGGLWGLFGLLQAVTTN